MALPKLPKFPLAGAGWRAGMDLNNIMKRITRQMLIGSNTVLVSNEDQGQRISIVNAAPNLSFQFGFAVRDFGSAIIVSPGKVVSSTWGSISGTDPKPGDWATETNFTGGTLPSTATAVWLKIEFSAVDYDSEGALGTQSINISGGAGGQGGGGGGGGASNGNTGLYTATSGTSGQDGQDGGAKGLAGQVLDSSTNLPIGANGQGAGGNGGAGGAGGYGNVGSSVTFTRKVKSVMARRRWEISSLSIHESKGVSSDLASWIKLATINSGNVVQHMMGSIQVAPPVVSFIKT